MWAKQLCVTVLTLIIIVYVFLNIRTPEADPIVKQLRGYPGPAPIVEFPFKNINDGEGNPTNILAIVAPFREKAHKRQLRNLSRKGFRFIGITSYLQFPGKVLNTHDPAEQEDMSWYIDKCIAWLYCGRDPIKTFGWSGIPRINMAQSDFTNPESVEPKGLEKKWDFIYICLDDDAETCPDGWNSTNRNWELAKKCFPIMCHQFGLKGLIVGRSGCEIDSSLDEYIERKEFIPYFEFVDHLEQARFTFLPNIMDASPRILTETLCKNNPVLVNKDIFGGWKYVTPETGEFFTSPEDIVPALEQLTKNYGKYQPRKYFMENYGPDVKGPILAQFLRDVYPLFTPCTKAEPYCCR